MPQQHRPLIASFLLAVLVAPPALATSTNRIVNGDFEATSAAPTDIPGWSKDGTATARVERIGKGGSAAAVLSGPAVLRSADLFEVTPGETLSLEADVWEMRDDNDGRSGVRGDSVLVIEFLTAGGASMRQLEFHCDAYVDLQDNDKLDESDTCTALDGFVHMMVRPCPTDCDSPECLKYREAIVVPAGAVRARLLLGGSLAYDAVDAAQKGASSPTSLTAFDNVLLS